jgi:hypothetical protein
MYYGDTQYWCWITSHYPSQRIGLEYLWMWIAALVVTVVYIVLALVVKGFVSVDGGRIRITIGQKRVHRDLTASHDGGAGRDGTSIAICLLFYPAVYIITIVPITIARFITFSNPNTHVPFAVTVFADVLFALSGLFNVILFAFTRPSVSPFRERLGPITLESSTISYQYD